MPSAKRCPPSASGKSRKSPASRADPLIVLSDEDLHWFHEGTHYKLYEKLGAQITDKGVELSVWAPNAEQVSVVGDFNGWDRKSHPMQPKSGMGLWHTFVPGLGKGTKYKFFIRSRFNGYEVEKADPFAHHAETAPRTASVVWPLDYAWRDQAWMKARPGKQGLQAPVSIYEVHIGSWRRHGSRGEHLLTYRALAAPLIEHMQKTGFTHVEFLPVMEHPFYGSWGYQTLGYFAPTSRYGTPQDFMFLVDELHAAGIGVILDWVPSHFPTDEHGLAYFDGSHLFEHQDPKEGFHPDWNSAIFNYGRNEVKSFLISSALFWLDRYHIDGLRVDAVASMLYRDYSRKHGEWVPNKYGGRENLEAIDFMRTLNHEVYTRFPGVQTYAEESTAWPMVSRPTYVGGLGFGYKWDMGWMHDILRYFQRDPIHRSHHHNELTFRQLYAYGENFVCSLSHDEVVHGKGSLLAKMAGDEWQKFANLRLLYGAMFAEPGKKLLFMGQEIGQWREWTHEQSLDWHLLDEPRHAQLMQWVSDLNAFYRAAPAMHEGDCDPRGFSWIDGGDDRQSVLSFMRHAVGSGGPSIAVVLNFTPMPRANCRVGVPVGGVWKERLNSDASIYGGSGQGNLGSVEAAPVTSHGQPYSLNLTLPPLGALFLEAPV
ncbi:MAG: 1,4-alpha-glucan branching protein GlgB [Deltaproteobacteria bacterium]|nr:1,4-alpha-glucan branching protein GlgB [Deltaproteobacteria bacterium]